MEKRWNSEMMDRTVGDEDIAGQEMLDGPAYRTDREGNTLFALVELQIERKLRSINC